MAETTSLSFPNMFNLSNNRVAVDEDLKSVTTRSRLLILSEPTELYNNPNFGVGLKRHLWKYNTENERAIFPSLRQKHSPSSATICSERSRFFRFL